MKFKQFAELLDKLENTAGRNEMTEILAEFLPKLSEEEIKPTMYLMQGRLVPTYIDIEFNISRKLAMKALASYVHPASQEIMKVSEADPLSEIESLFSELGDVGLVAEQILGSVSRHEEAGLSIMEVYSSLKDIADFSGTGSQEQKMRGVGSLVNKLDPISARYVVRMVIGNLRLGLSAKTVLDTLSWVKAGDKSLRAEIERAYGARGDIGMIAEIVLATQDDDLLKELKEIKVEAGIPVAAKLVEREKTSETVFERLGECVIQPKLDGLRAQLHMTDKGEVQIFSRNMENLTNSFPDLVSSLKKLKVKSIVLDSEAVGFDFENDTFLPFQETMQRRRKHNTEETALEIPVKAMVFDILFLDGKDLTQDPLQDRLKLLEKITKDSKVTKIEMLESPVVKSQDELEEIFREYIGEGLEGLIAKKLDTPYEPGTRNYDWIKLKANSRSDMVDTVDVVVLGYYSGRGVRAKFGMGALLVGLPDTRDGKYYSVAKVGTGMKDDDWLKIKSDLSEYEMKNEPENVVVNTSLKPNTWVKPEIVMEIDADEITRSPSHTTAQDLKANFELDTKGKGLSLRFPRMKVWNRDKKAEQATSVQELIKMYELRKGL